MRDVEIVTPCVFDGAADAVEERRPVLDGASASDMRDERRGDDGEPAERRRVRASRGPHHDAFALVWLGHWLLDLEHAADGLVGPVTDLACR